MQVVRVEGSGTDRGATLFSSPLQLDAVCGPEEPPAGTENPVPTPGYPRPLSEH